jgi:WD40 repeat protein
LGDFAALFEFLKEGVSRNFNFVRGKVINMDFSPDGRYFAAGAKSARDNEFLERNATVTSASKSGFPDGYTHYPENISEYGTTYRVGINTPERVLEALAFDLHARKQVSLGGSLKNLLTGRFTFVGADRLVGAHADDSSKSALVAFPSGEIVKPLSLGKGYLDAPGRGNYVLIRPIDKYPVGVMNLADGALFMANKQPALDIYDNVYVAARADGELGLYGVEKSDLRAKVQLPPSPLGPLEAAALSPDFRWLAVSGRTRGAVWDLNNGERIFHVRRFRSAHFAEGGAFYVDFPAQETIKRTIGILNPQRREALNGWEIEKIQGVRSSQMGQFFLSFRPAGKEKSSRKNALLDVKDVTSMKTLWSKAFPKETPSIWGDARNEMMVFGWNISTEAAKAEIKSDAVLSKRLAAMKEKEGDYFLQVVDAHTGEQRGRLLIETGKGSFVIWDVFVIGDRVVIGDSNNRVLVYSMTSGEQTGQVIGGHATVSKNSGLLCVENEKGQLTIYELATMQKRDEFSFSSPVSLARFSNDGKRLFVLTTSHTVYVLDVSSLSKSV